MTLSTYVIPQGCVHYQLVTVAVLTEFTNTKEIENNLPQSRASLLSGGWQYVFLSSVCTSDLHDALPLFMCDAQMTEQNMFVKCTMYVQYKTSELSNPSGWDGSGSGDVIEPSHTQQEEDKH